MESAKDISMNSGERSFEESAKEFSMNLGDHSPLRNVYIIVS
jgi:hypothetical protein